MFSKLRVYLLSMTGLIKGKKKVETVCLWHLSFHADISFCLHDFSITKKMKFLQNHNGAGGEGKFHQPFSTLFEQYRLILPVLKHLSSFDGWVFHVKAFRSKLDFLFIKADLLFRCLRISCSLNLSLIQLSSVAVSCMRHFPKEQFYFTLTESRVFQ